MATRLNPYLNFRDTALEAMTFYREVFGGELTSMPFSTIGIGDPDEQDKIMHAQLTTPSGYTLMGADVPNSMESTPGNAFSVSLSGGPDDEAELRGYWDKLVVGATVTAPLNKAPWGDVFGMCTDKFGVSWLVNIGGS